MITLEANYSKKIGLPGFSSHQFSVTLKTELVDASQVQAESTRLYGQLQQSVDSSIQQIGYPPGNAVPVHYWPLPPFQSISTAFAPFAVELPFSPIQPPALHPLDFVPIDVLMK